jgi:hypothetical protein
MSTVYEHIIKLPKAEIIEDDRHEMDILIFADDEIEEDETFLDNAY